MIMKHFKLLFLLFLSPLAALFAQTAAIPGAVPTEKALLWEISGNGLKQPSFLYGTIHMIGKKDFFLTPATKTALEKAKHVTFEINMEEMTDNVMALFPLLMQSFMRNDTTLSDLLTPQEYELVKKHFESIGLPFMMLNRIKPMFLTAMDPSAMTGMGAADGAGADGVVSYEMEFLSMAKAQKKTIGGLETAAFQMSMFDSIPYRVQAKMLVSSLSQEEGKSDGEFAKMVELYKSQDIQAMQTMMDNSEGVDGYQTLLLVNRNKKWIPIMGKMMTEKPTFFAVGAGHLGGVNGVIALLRKAGYTVQAKI
jgi:uncharacterized protein YbaP (TraB family)